MLQEVVKEIAPALTLLFQTSRDTDIVPVDWRTTRVTPVFKKGENKRTRKLPTYLFCEYSMQDP